MEPTGSSIVASDSYEFTELNAFIEIKNQYKYQLSELFKLQNSQNLEKFTNMHRKDKILTLYTAIDEQEQNYINSSFNPFPAQSYVVFTTYPLSKCSLECNVALNKPFITEDAKSCTEAPPFGFDSFVLIKQESVVIKNYLEVDNEQLESEPLEFFISKSENILPLEFLLLNSKSLEISLKKCDVCLFCVKNKITHDEYFQTVKPSTSYNHGEINEAIYYCEEDNAYLCEKCDLNLHENAIEAEHERKLVQRSEIGFCSTHKLQFEYIDKATGRFLCQKCKLTPECSALRDINICDSQDYQFDQVLANIQDFGASIIEKSEESEEILVQMFKKLLGELKESSENALETLLWQYLMVFTQRELLQQCTNVQLSEEKSLDQRIQAYYYSRQVANQHAQFAQLEAQNQAALSEIGKFYAETTSRLEVACKTLLLQQFASETVAFGGPSQKPLTLETQGAEIAPQSENDSPLEEPGPAGGLLRNTAIIQEQLLAATLPRNTALEPLLQKQNDYIQEKTQRKRRKNSKMASKSQSQLEVGPASEEQDDTRNFERTFEDAQLEALNNKADVISQFDDQKELFGTLRLSQQQLQDIRLEGKENRKEATLQELEYINFEPAIELVATPTNLELKNDNSVPKKSYEQKIVLLYKMYKIKESDIFNELEKVPFAILHDEAKQFDLFLFTLQYLKLLKDFPKLRFIQPQNVSITNMQALKISYDRGICLIILDCGEFVIAIFFEAFRTSEEQPYAFSLNLTAGTYESSIPVSINPEYTEIGEYMIQNSLKSLKLKSGKTHIILNYEANVFRV